MGNSFGNLFKISTWGESHGGGIGVTIDGCPPKVPLALEDIQVDLDRRRPGQSEITTPRKESDTAEIVSGVYEGYTLGTPIAIYVPNGDHRPEAYKTMRDAFRPSHADYTYQTKFGIRNQEGADAHLPVKPSAGLPEARLRKILRLAANIEIRAYISRVHDIEMPPTTDFLSLEEVEASPVRCPHPETAQR